MANEFGKVKGQNKFAHIEYLKRHNIPFERFEGLEARKLQYDNAKANVLIASYFNVQEDYTFLIQNRSPNFAVVFDELQEFKNRKSFTHIGANEISKEATRVYGLSATIIKNRLEEAYNIYKVIVPGLFGSVARFNKEFIKLKKMHTFRGKKKLFFNKIIGYKNLKKFRETIDPYFLIRKTKDVAEELPSLISKKVVLELTAEQLTLYQGALNGAIYRERAKSKYFEFRDQLEKTTFRTEKDYNTLALLYKIYEESLTEEGLSKNKISALSYCQLVSNGPQWLGPEEVGPSSKEIEFKRMFDQELRYEKTIVFTRFKSGIPRLEAILRELGINYTGITGDVKKDDRKKARLSFQDTTKDVQVIFITTAGSAALNLQSANIILFYDTPWSYGDLYQTIGRAQRIGSVHNHIYAIHMVNKKTIDEHVLKILEGKKQLITDVMGDIAQGAVDFKAQDSVIFKDVEGSIEAIFNSVFKRVH
jgi:SNF2 family DNA or RNA helicase